MSHPRENILSKWNPIQTMLVFCFFIILYHLLFFLFCLLFTTGGSMPPSVPTFPERRPFLQTLLTMPPSFPPLSPFQSLLLSFDSYRSTFNGSYPLIKYLQVSAALWQGRREKERWRQRERQKVREQHLVLFRPSPTWHTVRFPVPNLNY